MKKALGVLIAIVLAAIVMLYNREPEVAPKLPTDTVSVSTFALYDIAGHLLYGIANVSMLIPFGTDIHAYEPTPQDMIRVEKSRLFLYSGAGLEPWANAFVSHAPSKDMSQFVSLHPLDQDEHGHHDDHKTDPAGFDPHYWLDFENMRALTEAMRQIFSEMFPEHSQELKARSERYIAMLESLQEQYRKRLDSCQKRTIVVSHNAYGYLAKQFDFEVLSLSGFTSDALPSAKQVAWISDQVRDRNITMLFDDPFEPSPLLQSVATQSGIEVSVLQPLANLTRAEAEQRQSYQLLMQLNLRALSQAMVCR